jgi:hypothetical protein
MSDGTEQSQRRPAALAGAQFRVDELGFESLLALTAEFARRLRFVDVDGHDNADWGDLLAGNEVVAMARVASLDLAGEQAGFAQAFEGAAVETLADRVADLDRRLRNLLDGLPAPALARLGGGVDALVATAPQATLQRLRERTGGEPAPAAAPVALPDRSALRAAFFALVGAARRMGDLARRGLPAALDSGDQPPAIGLLAAFLQVYPRVQSRINAFGERHCDFYFNDCLRMPDGDPVPERLHLVIGRGGDPKAEVEVPAGASFIAGQDAQGRTIEFTADRAVRVTDARVAALKTLRLERDPLVAPECSFGHVTRAAVAQFDSVAGGPARSLFGGPVPGLPDADGDARLGLALSAPALWLAEGERQLALTLHLSCPDRRGYAAQIADLEAAPSWSAFQDKAGELFARWLLDPRPDPGNARGIGGTADAEGIPMPAVLQRRRRTGDAPDGPLDWWPLTRGEVSRIRDLVKRRAQGAPGQPHFPEIVRDWCEAVKRPVERPRDRSQDRPGSGEAAWPAPDQVREGHPLSLFIGQGCPQRDLVLDNLFNGVFVLGVSTAAGWLEAASAVVRRADPDAEGERGLALHWRLGPEAPPVVACTPKVHGAEWPARHPVLRLTVNPRARLHPWSLLQAVRLAGLDLRVGVKGVRDLQLFNQLGRLDASKPFAPFGPLPDAASYLVVGGAEIARKPIEEFSLHVHWSGLPDGPGGFSDHYRAYDRAWNNASFVVTTSILRNGEWQAAASGAAATPLFDAEAPNGRLFDVQTIDLDPAAMRTQWQGADRPVPLDQGARGGHVRLQLSGPSGAFGHGLYPGLLTQGLTAQVRRRKSAVIPPAPYTPVIERVSLDYRATVRMRLARGSAATDAAGVELMHLHPFGVERLYPAPVAFARPVLPSVDGDGHLYIGLAAIQLAGPLTLLFEMRDDIASEPHRLLDPEPRFEWHLLAEDRWQRLAAEQELDNTTHGFRTSGVVTLDLPEGATLGNRILPGDLFWLRLSTDAASRRFAGLRSVSAQAVPVRRVVGAGRSDEPPAAKATWQAGSPIAGVTRVVAVGAPTGRRPAESTDQRRIRIAERLRHKQRAFSAWDYERIVLEAFPSVRKVRCFPGLHSPSGEQRAGHVLVVVVPELPADDLLSRARPHRLTAVELRDIAHHLQPLISPCAKLLVRNAAFERIQVRCTISLERGANRGRTVQQVNEALIDYLSPWRESGPGASFEWSLRSEDVASCIRDAVPQVRSVSGLSLLQISEDDDGRFRLDDSALVAQRRLRPGGAAARARWQWTLALSTETHLIDVAAPDRSEAGVEVTGIDRLAIDESFVVGEAIAQGTPP